MDFYQFRTKENKERNHRAVPRASLSGGLPTSWSRRTVLRNVGRKEGLVVYRRVRRSASGRRGAVREADDPKHTGRLDRQGHAVHETGTWSSSRSSSARSKTTSHQLDQDLMFANDGQEERLPLSGLPYSLEPGECSAWNEIVGTLFNVEERAKIEWIIGAIVSGDCKDDPEVRGVLRPARIG